MIDLRNTVSRRRFLGGAALASGAAALAACTPSAGEKTQAPASAAPRVSVAPATPVPSVTSPSEPSTCSKVVRRNKSQS